MIILLHIFTALASMAYATYTALVPSRAKLGAVYGLVCATLVSGTYLALSTKTPLMQSCMMGLLYLGFIALSVATARLRLVKVKNK